MTIREKIREIMWYYSINRRVGYTTLLKEGTKHYDKDFLILTNGKVDSDFLEVKPEQIVSWNNLDILRGNDKPMVIDNGILVKILEEVLEEMYKLYDENLKLKSKNHLLFIKKPD